MGMALTLLLALQQDSAAEAQQHYDRSRQLSSQGLYEDAIAELEAAERLQPSPTIAYELALAYSTVDRCQAAIEAYQRVLRFQPENRVEIQKKIVEQEWRLSHNECKDRPAKPPPTAG